MEALKAAQSPPPPAQDTTIMDTGADPGNETTYGANTTVASSAAASSSTASKGTVKKKGKPKLTAKEKKEHALYIERIVTALPLEFRGNDPNLRRQIEQVIEGFLHKEGRGLASMSPSSSLKALPTDDLL